MLGTILRAKVLFLIPFFLLSTFPLQAQFRTCMYDFPDNLRGINNRLYARGEFLISVELLSCTGFGPLQEATFQMRRGSRVIFEETAPINQRLRLNANDYETGLHRFSVSSNFGPTVILDVSIIKDEFGPKIGFRNLTRDSVIRGLRQIRAEITDESGLEKVEYFVNDTLVETTAFGTDDIETNTSITFDSSAFPDGRGIVEIVATDNYGNVGSNSREVYLYNAPEPPTITIGDLGNGNEIGGTITVNANLSHKIGPAPVYFRLGGALIGQDYEAPFQATTDTRRFGSGLKLLQVTFTDLAGRTARAEKVVTLSNGDIEGPTINIVGPGSNPVSRSVSLSAQITDASAIERVSFFLNDIHVETFSAGPYEHMLDTTALQNGLYLFKVTALDTEGNSSEIVQGLVIENISAVPTPIDPEQPQPDDTLDVSVRIAQPAHGTILTTGTTIQAEAYDDVGIKEVQFYINGKLLNLKALPPYRATLTTTDLTSGANEITVSAIDFAGKIASEVITVIYQPENTDAEIETEAETPISPPTLESEEEQLASLLAEELQTLVQTLSSIIKKFNAASQASEEQVKATEGMMTQLISLVEFITADNNGESANKRVARLTRRANKKIQRTIRTKRKRKRRKNLRSARKTLKRLGNALAEM